MIMIVCECKERRKWEDSIGVEKEVFRFGSFEMAQAFSITFTVPLVFVCMASGMRPCSLQEISLYGVFGCRLPYLTRCISYRAAQKRRCHGHSFMPLDQMDIWSLPSRHLTHSSASSFFPKK